MAIKLVRESSETPNITNKDDTKMIRYAYGGYTGFVKEYGNELSYSISGSVLKINSGRIVLGGWEIDVAEDSWELDLSAISGTQYYTIYVEANIATEIAQIKSSYASGAYPDIEEGDDLTKYPSGMARAVLYHAKSVSGSLSEIEKIIEPIPYLKEIEERLERLGFRQGELTFTEDALSRMINPPTKNIVTRQGNYVIIETEFYMSISGNEKIIIAVIPDKFRPKKDIIVSMNQVYLVAGATTMTVDRVVRVNTDGEISLNFENILGSGLYDAGTIGNLSFGYEANPL